MNVALKTQSLPFISFKKLGLPLLLSEAIIFFIKWFLCEMITGFVYGILDKEEITTALGDIFKCFVD